MTDLWHLQEFSDEFLILHLDVEGLSVELISLVHILIQLLFLLLKLFFALGFDLKILHQLLLVFNTLIVLQFYLAALILPIIGKLF